jgi:hypothetical protein
MFFYFGKTQGNNIFAVDDDTAISCRLCKWQQATPGVPFLVLAGILLLLINNLMTIYYKITN